MEAQEDNPEQFDEYLNMDKETIIRMLIASQIENKKLHARLDKQDEEARAREERLNKRIDELTSINTRSSESQIKMMDQLTELHRQIKQMNEQHAELLAELKRQKDLNKQARKDKYDSTKQAVDKDNHKEDNHDEGQRGDRVQQKDDFNGDPETLKDVCQDVAHSDTAENKTKEEREYRKGMKYNKSVSTKVYHHNCDVSKLPEGCEIIGRKTKMLKSLKLMMNVHEYDFIKVKFPDGHIEWMYLPEDVNGMEYMDDEYISHVEYRPFGNTGLAADSIPSLAYMRYGLSTPANRLAGMLKEAGLGGCRQTIINWLKEGGDQLAYLLPSLKNKLLSEGANVNCDETWSRMRREYHDGYKKVYVW